MNEPRIIALCGLAGSGKDTAAAMIKDVVGNTETLALADISKEIASKSLNIPITNFYDRTLKDAGTNSPRKQMVRLFDSLFSKYGEDYTLKMNIEKIDALIASKKNVIITDMRYPVEFEYARSNGIPIYRIERDVISTIDHHTEKARTIGTPIDNNGNLSELRSNIESVFG